MAGLIYYDTNIYTTANSLLTALKSIPNFWDEVGETTLTKGGVTISVSGYGSGGNNAAMTGYGRSITLHNPNSQHCYIIAATAKGLVMRVSGSGSTSGIAIGSDKNGNWGGVFGNATSSSTGISDLLADNLTSTTFTGGDCNVANINTQIIDLAADKGNFIFDDLRRVLYTVSALKPHYGKLTMPNGEKYVKCGAFALRYTE